MNKPKIAPKPNTTPKASIKSLKMKTNVKAGGLQARGISLNRCETLQLKAMPLKVKTNIKAGGLHRNRCEVLQCQGTPKEYRKCSMQVKTNVKAGGVHVDGIRVNRCEIVVHPAMAVVVKTNIKAGG